MFNAAKETQALIYGLSAVLMWSTVASAFKIGLQLLTVAELLLGASIFSILLLTVVLYLRSELQTAVRSLWPSRYTSIKFALLNPVLYYFVLFESYDRLPAQVAQPINYTWAILLTILCAIFAGKKVSRTDILGMLLAYFGVLFISVAGQAISGALDHLGLLLAVVGTVLWAVFWLWSSRDRRPAVIALFHNFLYALPILLFLSIYLQWGQWSPLSWAVLASVAYIGVFEMGLAFVMWQLALRTTQNPARISVLIFLSPFISLIIIHYVLGEPLQWLTFIGLVMIVFGLLLQRCPWSKCGG